MKHTFIRFLLRLAVFTIPYTALAVLGIVWLAQHQLALPFAAIVAIVSIIAWLAVRWYERRPVTAPAEPPPSNTWSPAAKQAWARVDAIARRVEQDPPDIQDLAKWQALGLEVLEAAARPFHSESKHAVTAVTIPDALRLGEVILHDLRTTIDQNIPLADSFKLDVIPWVHSMKEEYSGGRSWGTLLGYARTASTYGYWGTRAVISPSRTLISGLQQAAVGSSTRNLIGPLTGEIAARFVRITGRYAIDLYSGQLKLTDEVKAAAKSKPLQVLLLGQTKAGKSSLVNALFGSSRAETDILPCTDTITRHVIKIDGLPNIHLLDSVGFGGADDQKALKFIQNEVSKCDLILMVCSAANAAREADRALLDGTRAMLNKLTQRALPPIIVAVTHIDTIRPFTEWQPPYDFAHGQRPKESNVRAACDAIAGELQVPREEVVPVCTHPDRTYNIEEGLTAQVLKVLPAADQAKLLRHLQETMSAEAWERQKRQLINLGINVTTAVAAATVATYAGPGVSRLLDSGASLAKQFLLTPQDDTRDDTSGG